LSDVVFFEAESNYTTVYLQNCESLIQSGPMAEMENLPEDYPEFMHIHRSLIVNAKHIENYTKGEICMIKPATGHSFEISRRRKSELLQKLSTFQL